MVNQSGRSESFLTATPASPAVRATESALVIQDRFGMQETPLTTWSSLLSHHAGKFDKQALGASVLDDAFPKRWKLLITVIDCSHTPRLVNPPRSIEALRARLTAAVGIESGESKSKKGHTEATAQAIMTGLEGPERKALNSDEDLCLFWENVTSGKSPAAPVSRSSTFNEHDRERVSTKAKNRDRRQSLGRSDTSQSRRQSRDDSDLPEISGRGDTSRPSAKPTADLTNTRDLHAVDEDDEQEEEDDDLDCEQTSEGREKEMQQQVARNEELRLAAEAKLADVQAQMELLQYRKEELEVTLNDSEEKCRSLQEENLQFIKAFNENVEQKMAELCSQLDKKYQAEIQQQGKILAETQSQVKRLEGMLEIRDEKIREVEGSLREQRAAFVKLAAGFEEEREKFEEERKRLAAKVQRVRQLEFFADCWRRKVAELTDVSGKELRFEEDSLQFRINCITIKLEEFQKGRLVQSPEFEVPELGKVQFEFFPTGDVNSREGWCSFRLRVPDQTRLRWSAFIGKRRMGPRTDKFDTRQWWCRYGLLWLNFCPLSDVRSEVSPETDTLLCGIEVHEILPSIDDDVGVGTPIEAAMAIPRDRFGISRHGERSVMEEPSEEFSPATTLATRSLGTPKAKFASPPPLLPTPQVPRKLARPQSVPNGLTREVKKKSAQWPNQ